MSKKLCIGIDCDDVTVDFINPFLQFYNIKNKSNFNYDQITTYNLWEIFGCTREESIKIVREYYRTTGFDNLPVNEEAVKTLNSLDKIANRFILTSRYAEAIPKTRELFARTFPEMQLPIEFAGEFQEIPISKAEVCKRKKATHIIEDNAHYALQCAETGMTSFLITRPWNKNAEKHQNVIPINSISDVISYL